MREKLPLRVIAIGMVALLAVTAGLTVVISSLAAEKSDPLVWEFRRVTIESELTEELRKKLNEIEDASHVFDKPIFKHIHSRMYEALHADDDKRKNGDEVDTSVALLAFAAAVAEKGAQLESAETHLQLTQAVVEYWEIYREPELTADLYQSADVATAALVARLPNDARAASLRARVVTPSRD